MNNIKFDFNDIMLTPETTKITSRSDVNILSSTSWSNKLPIFTAPMDTVIDENNFHYFYDNGIIPVLPRGTETYNVKKKIGSKNYFVSYSLNGAKNRMEFIKLILRDTNIHENWCIDVANGHMQKLIDLITEIKNTFPNIKIMSGNVATPEGYRILSEAGADFIRVGIGGGSGCLTSTHTAIGYPMASLVEDCYKISTTLDQPAAIIADGGIKTYSDIIKALSLGANYVMLGGVFNKALESCGKTTLFGIEINQYSELTEFLFESKFPIKKKFRGMSTKAVQRKWGKKKLRSAEGVTRTNEVKYTLEGWVDNLKDYLQSSMSYKNCNDLNKFIGSAVYDGKVFITESAKNRINK